MQGYYNVSNTPKCNNDGCLFNLRCLKYVNKDKREKYGYYCITHEPLVGKCKERYDNKFLKYEQYKSKR